MIQLDKRRSCDPSVPAELAPKESSSQDSSHNLFPNTVSLHVRGDLQELPKRETNQLKNFKDFMQHLFQISF